MLIFAGLLRKRLNFDFVDTCDLDYHVDNEDNDEDEDIEDNVISKPSLSKKAKYPNNDSSPASSSLQLTPNSTSLFSPCRTRSGRIYIAGSSSAEKTGEKKPLFQPPRPKLALNLLQKNLDNSRTPPPLNYVKRPVSRIQSRLSRPASDPLDPPTNEVRAMRLFDAPAPMVTSPVSAPRLQLAKSRFCFDENNRRVSAPAPGSNIYQHEEKKRKRTANINPFTPTSILASMRKKARMTSGESNAERYVHFLER